MLSLLRWGLGSGREHQLTSDKVHTQEELGEKQDRQHQLPKTMSPTPNGTVKRKRGKSTQSQHRPLKRNPKPSKEVRSPTIDLTTDSNQAEPKTTPKVSSGDDEDAQPDAMEWDHVKNLTEPEKLTDTDAESERLSKLKGAISRQFNLEILLKHNELRLIDQEIAKVQIALEQLRRCSVIPYPALTGETNDILNVSQGRGMIATSEPGQLPASHPPPWGVTDGPYSRHYAKWLLPDPTFDGGAPEPARTMTKGDMTVPDRHTRGGKELSLPMTKPRQRPGLARYQAVNGANGDEHKTKGPMILKRALDGKLVKLVCPNCHREDFNSAQGFINHCRIAHSLNLASHEAAARECGQEIDPNEVVMTVPETAAPASAAPQSAVTTGFVHPMNRTQMPAVPKLSMPKPKRALQKPVAALSQPVPVISSGSFKPSEQVPHLSRLFAKLGKAVDLTAAVEDATAKPIADDQDESEESESEPTSEFDDDNDDETTPTSTGMARFPQRVSTRGGPSLSSGSARPKSRKGPERVMRRPYSSEARSTQITLPDHKDNNDLSPNTITSGNAPSLISDSENASDEEDDDYSSGVHGKSSSEDDSGEEEDDKDIDVDMHHELPLTNGFDEDHASSSQADPELRASAKARSHRGPTAPRAKSSKADRKGISRGRKA